MSLLGEPAPDFSDPLGMLAACHGRMLGFCDLLERLPAWVADHGIDAEALAGARRVLRYFDGAAPLHHADEEHDLFPMLAGDPAAARLIARLNDEHRQLEGLWQRLAAELRGLSGERGSPATLRAAVTPFCAAYRAHIERENAELLPRARALLTAPALERLGERMAARRSATGPRQSP